jgi:glycosyltransferase involved in cell wall biosynthesis
MTTAGLMPERLSRGVRVDGRIARPLKLCFISPLGYGLYRPESEQPFGGAEVQFFLLSHEVAADPDFQVTVLTTVGGEPGAEQRGRLTLIKRLGRGRLSAEAKGSLRGYAEAFADMHRTLRAIDADVYFHAGAGVEVGAYALICRSLRRRFVFVVASSADLAQEPRLVKGPLRWLYPLGLRMADAIVCRTGEQCSAVRERCGRDGVVIRTGHSLPTPTAAAPAAKTTILWVGRMHPLKQPELFLDLAERLPKERFAMAVSRDEAHRELLQAVRSRASRLPNLSLLEDVPWSRIGRCFEEAKLFVNTSTYEGFPNTFVQAALHGAPILSWTVDPDRVLTRHRIGFCAGGSFERLAAALEDLCANDPLRAELARQARIYASQHHDLGRAAEDLKTLCRSLLVQGGG